MLSWRGKRVKRQESHRDLAIDVDVAMRHNYIFVGTNNSDRFLYFIKGLEAFIGKEKALLVINNLTIDKSKRVAEVLASSEALCPSISFLLNHYEHNR
jgi:hypothetical protein